MTARETLPLEVTGMSEKCSFENQEDAAKKNGV